MRLVSVFCCIMVAGCVDGERLSAFLNPDELEGENAGPQSVQNFRGTIVIPNAAQYQAALTNSAEDAPSTGLARLYLQAGIALSDELCAFWFRRVGEAQAKVRADRDALSNIGALSATALGLANVNSAVVGGLAGGFGFLEDTFTSELANFIAAADLSTVEQAILVDRSNKAAELDLLSLNFYQTRRALIAYDNTCSQLSVNRVVNKSIENTIDLSEGDLRRLAKERAARPTGFGALLINRVADELGSIFAEIAVVTSREVVALHAILNRSSDLADEVLQGFAVALLRANMLENGSFNLREGRTIANVRELIFRANVDGGLDRQVDAVVDRARAIMAAGEPEEDEQPAQPGEDEQPAQPGEGERPAPPGESEQPEGGE